MLKKSFCQDGEVKKAWTRDQFQAFNHDTMGRLKGKLPSSNLGWFHTTNSMLKRHESPPFLNASVLYRYFV